MENFVRRTFTGTVFVAVVLAGLCINLYFYALIFCLIMGIALWEFYGLINHRKFITLDIMGSFCLFTGTFMLCNRDAGEGDRSLFFIPYLIYLMFVLIRELYDKSSSHPVHRLALTFLPHIYIALPFSLLNFIVMPGPETFAPTPYAVALFVFIWVNDTAAYLVGSQFGKRRLMKRISPKKSWEGFGGGLIAAIVASQAFAYFYRATAWYNWLGLAVVIVIFAVWGDLTESLVKRSAGVKDSGNLLPGHGGLLDRLDSALLAIPALFIYLKLFIQN
jgi:phosphatidate cytidylyltransferase